MMAEPETPPEGQTAECLACRGTGTLTSGLGGTPHDVRCPWCEGTGHRIPGIDAQAHPAEGEPAQSEPPQSEPAQSEPAEGTSAADDDT